MSTATAVKIPTPEQEALSPEEQRAWRALMRAHTCLAKRLESALDGAHRLPLTSYEVLQRLEEDGEGRMRMCDLAACVLLSRSGLTRLIDRLEREGLVARHSCEQDARGAYARLTEAALSLRGLLGQDVALVRLVPAHLARSRDLEALRRPLVGFHFWHLLFSIDHAAAAPPEKMGGDARSAQNRRPGDN